MSEYEEIIKNVPLKQSSMVPRGGDIFYRCDFCQTIIISIPAEKIASCACGRLDVDTIMLRLGYDENNLTVLRRIGQYGNVTGFVYDKAGRLIERSGGLTLTQSYFNTAHIADAIRRAPGGR